MVKVLRYKLFTRTIAFIVVTAFCLTNMPSLSYAQGLLGLPAPGTPVSLSPGFIPTILRGIRTYPNNPFEFDFIVDSGDAKLEGEAFNKEAEKLVKYFLASLTVPEDDLWVNLSPYEKDRIVPKSFGETEMGRDLLAQDYLLKQITASMIDPETDLGKEFWQKIYKKAYEQFGTTNIPVDTFNKVWIMPEKVVVYENADKAFIVESRLKVMLEEDYIALANGEAMLRDSSRSVALQESQKSKIKSQSENQPLYTTYDIPHPKNALASSIVREVVLPELEKEVNEGKNFANLRQIYNSLILATWFKETLKNSILNQKYSDQNKIKGVDIEDKDAKQKIYGQYLAAYKKGVCDIMKVEYDPYAHKAIPRKYFSGGVKFSWKGIKNTFQKVYTWSRKFSTILGKLQQVYLKFKVSDGQTEPTIVQGAEKRFAAPKVVSSTLENKGDLSQRTAKINGLQNAETDKFYIDPEEAQILTEINMTLKKLRSLTEEKRSRELEVLFSQMQSSELSELKRVAISIILARQNVIDYKKEAIHQLLKYVNTKKGNLSDDHVRNSRLLSSILEELAHHYRRTNIAWDKVLAQEVGKELQWWLVDAWGSLPSVCVLLALYSKPGFNLRDAVVGEARIGQLLEEKGIDIATIKALLTQAKLNISKQRYHHWNLNVAQSISGKKLGPQRQPFLATMLSPASKTTLDGRISELKDGDIPRLLIETLKEKGISEDEIVSMYVTGSYLWGDEVNRPTDLDIYVITSRNIEDRMRIPLNKDLFPPGFARAPPYAEVTIRPIKMFEHLSATKQHLERHKILLYYSSIPIFGKDIFAQAEISNDLLGENLLVYAQDLFVNGKQYLERFYDHIKEDPGRLRQIEAYLKGLKGGSLVPAENFDSKLSAQIKDEGQAFYFIQKAARRLYDAEVILNELDPFLSSKVDFARLREDFCKANITSEHFDLLKQAYEQLEEHINDTRSFFEKNNQVSLLQGLINKSSSDGDQVAGFQNEQGISSSPSFVRPLDRDLSRNLDESNHTNYRGADDYDGVFKFLLGQKLKDIIAKMIDKKGLAFFADFGHGHGVALQQFKKMFGDRLKTWGIDIAEKTLADMGPIAYKKFIEKYGEDGVKEYLSEEKSFDYIQGSVLDAKITDDQGRPALMDLITCLYVLQYTKDPFKGWLNMFHQLADNGVLVSQFLFYDNKQGRENLKFYIMIFDKLKEAGIDIKYDWASVTRPVTEESEGVEEQIDSRGGQAKKAVERLTGEIVLYVSAVRVKGQKITIPIEVLSDKISDVTIYIKEGKDQYSYNFYQVSYKIVGNGILSVDSRISDKEEQPEGGAGASPLIPSILTKLIFDDLRIPEKYPSLKTSHHCEEASRDIARALKEKGISYFGRAVYVPFIDSPSAGTLHEIVEADVDGKIYVVDTQLEQFEDDLGLDEDFVKQRIYLAEDYYHLVKAYDSPEIEAESRVVSAQLTGIRSSSRENDNTGGVDFKPANLNIERQGRGVAPFDLSNQGMENIEIDGLFPVIINVTPFNLLDFVVENGAPQSHSDLTLRKIEATPVTSLPLLFGASPEDTTDPAKELSLAN